MASKKQFQTLPVYTDDRLNVGQLYLTIDLNNQFYEVGTEVELVNDNAKVTGIGKIVSTKLASFDHISSNNLQNFSNPHLALWPNAVEYFVNRFKEHFSYSGEIQLVTFEVTGSIKFDIPLHEEVEMSKELGLPSDKELGTEE